MRIKVIFCLLPINLFLLLVDIFAQPQITYQDALNWSGGRFQYYSMEGDSAPNPNGITISIDTGSNIWDFRTVPFYDTVEYSFEEPRPAEVTYFPTANRVEWNSFSGISLFLINHNDLRMIEHLDEKSLTVIGTCARYSDTSDFSKILHASNIDTLLKFPISIGQTIDSKLDYTEDFSSRYPYFNYDWVLREVNSFGKMILPNGDTTNVIGVRTLGKLVCPDDNMVFCEHSYSWYSPEKGLIAKVVIFPFESIVDSTLFTPGSRVAYSETYRSSIVAFILRLQDDTHGLLQFPTKKRIAAKNTITNQQIVMNLLGQTVTNSKSSVLLIKKVYLQGRGVYVPCIFNTKAKN